MWNVQILIKDESTLNKLMAIISEMGLTDHSTVSPHPEYAGEKESPYKDLPALCQLDE